MSFFEDLGDRRACLEPPQETGADFITTRRGQGYLHRMKFFYSIRWRLQLWHGLLLMLVLAGFGFTAWQLQWATLFNMHGPARTAEVRNEP